ncbi:hypothetical protein PVL29_025501 [Vitis rotundifolia]|uniref:non-specific serine/threonine protein kinase n=1 Tax=Vitis rotundifolia TaxID=103349 RepID=A0AA38YJW3_VITRO|nr:hypothetical protein PVL29_025501 [Vitis rotundifolia]
MKIDSVVVLFLWRTLFKPTFVANKEEAYHAFEAMDSAIYSGIVILESGLVQHFSWIGDLQWAVLYGIQKDHCDAYNLCGPFGVCYIINQSPKCECMMGFTPNSPKDWEVFNTFGGCVWISPLECQRGNGFVKYPGMKLPDSSNLWVNVSMGTKECRAECLKNCSCTGYAEMDTHGKGKGCLMWFGPLIDIRQSTSFGQDLYVRMSASELESIADSQKRRRRLKLLLVLLAFFAVLISDLLLWYIAWKKKRAHGRDDKTIDNNERYLTDESLEDEEEGKFPLFDLTTIAAATKNFAFANKIGEGGFGPVYKVISIMPIVFYYIGYNPFVDYMLP